MTQQPEVFFKFAYLLWNSIKTNGIVTNLHVNKEQNIAKLFVLNNKILQKLSWL